MPTTSDRRNLNYRQGSAGRRRKKRRIAWGRIILIVLIFAAVITGVILLLTHCHKSPGKGQETVQVKYIAGTSSYADTWYYDDYEQRLMKVNHVIPRGTEIEPPKETYTENGRTYLVTEYNGEKYYIHDDCLVDSTDDLVRETDVWVRTSATIYKDTDSPKIASWARKGTNLNVIGFDKLLEDGSVNMYKVQFNSEVDGNVTGWVYGKYMTDSEEKALAVNEEINELHKDRVYKYSDLGGGLPTTLDWFPVEKPQFEDNPILQEARAMYLYAEVFPNIDDYIQLALDNNVNCMCMDVKGSALSCQYDAAAEYAPFANEKIWTSQAKVEAVAQKIKDAGLYLICRIVIFNDSCFAHDHPEECIESESASQLWPSGFSRACWEYNLTLAEEVIERYHPNEIQFDYVRFPEEAYAMSQDETTDFKNKYNEEKAEAIQNFLFYATDVIHRHNVYLSADVFGECSGKYVTAYGQYFPAISNVVDAISSMPYVDHFGFSTDTWTDAYTTMRDWAEAAHNRQSEIATPAIARTWVTGWNVPWWAPTITCDGDYIYQQVKALYDMDLPGGFLVWNGISSMVIYEQCADGWARHYTDNPDFAPVQTESADISEEIEEEETS